MTVFAQKNSHSSASPVLRLILAVCVVSLLGACSASLHGSFATSSYAGEPDGQVPAELGSAQGRSCQTQVLYVFPAGDAPTTAEAIDNAKRVHPGTRFIADISIDDETLWHIGYRLRCIVVRATAYQ